MSQLSVLYYMVRADVQERTRRYSFLVTMAAAVYLGYAVNAGYVFLHLGKYRGVYNSAWIGILTAMSTVLFVSLVGFYIIKNSVDRDRHTGVGQILAATQIGKVMYLAGKWISNFVVLLTIVLVQAFAAVVIQLIHREDPHFDLWELLSPFLLIAIPAMAFIAGLAILFESIRWLRKGFGNVLYFFFWSAMLAVPMELNIPQADMVCLHPVQSDMEAKVLAEHPDYKEGFSLNAGPQRAIESFKTFRWEGLHISGDFVSQRMMWFVYAFILILISSLFFDRFDTTPQTVQRSKKIKEKARTATAVSLVGERISHILLNAVMPRFTFPQLVLAEVRLMLKGLPRWWYLVLSGLNIACIASPAEVVRDYLLPFVWILPVLVWSSMGVREARYGTGELLFSAPRILLRQLPALWFAGVAVVAITGCGALLGFLINGDGLSIAMFCMTIVFIPSFSLVCGVWSNTSKLFEALYTTLWYIGPMNHVKELDFIGTSVPVANSQLIVFLILSAGLFGVALVGRKAQMVRAS